jgi:hypothetical protein
VGQGSEVSLPVMRMASALRGSWPRNFESLGMSVSSMLGFLMFARLSFRGDKIGLQALILSVHRPRLSFP